MGTGKMTAGEFQEYLRQKKQGSLTGKRHKLNAKRTKDMDGVENPSWLHAEVANMLINRRNKKESLGFQREVPIRLKERCKACGERPLVFKIDFVETQLDNTPRYIEAKGMKTASFKKRERQWRVTGPGDMEIWMGIYRNDACLPYKAETIRVGKG